MNTLQPGESNTGFGCWGLMEHNTELGIMSRCFPKPINIMADSAILIADNALANRIMTNVKYRDLR
jgi:hypothetical protein